MGVPLCRAKFTHFARRGDFSIDKTSAAQQAAQNGANLLLKLSAFDEGIEYERAFIASLDSEHGLEEACKKLALIHKQSVAKGELDLFWERATAMCAASIGKAIFHESGLRVIRREIRRTTGLLIDQEDLAKAIHDMMCQEAREEIGPLRIRKKRKVARTRTPKAEPPQDVAVLVSPTDGQIATQ